MRPVDPVGEPLVVGGHAQLEPGARRAGPRARPRAACAGSTRAPRRRRGAGRPATPGSAAVEQLVGAAPQLAGRGGRRRAARRRAGRTPAGRCCRAPTWSRSVDGVVVDDVDDPVGRPVLALAVGDGGAVRRRRSGPCAAGPAATSCFRRLSLQPAQQERLVGLDVALVVLHPDGVEAVDDGPVQRGAAPAGRVEEPHRLAGQHPGEPAGGHGQRQVHEEVRQALVGLAGVALDRDDVVVVAPQRRRPPAGAAARPPPRTPRAATDRLPSTASAPSSRPPSGQSQDEVVDARQRPSLDARPRGRRARARRARRAPPRPARTTASP